MKTQNWKTTLRWIIIIFLWFWIFYVGSDKLDSFIYGALSGILFVFILLVFLLKSEAKSDKKIIDVMKSLSERLDHYEEQSMVILGGLDKLGVLRKDDD